MYISHWDLGVQIILILWNKSLLRYSSKSVEFVAFLERNLTMVLSLRGFHDRIRRSTESKRGSMLRQNVEHTSQDEEIASSIPRMHWRPTCKADGITPKIEPKTTYHNSNRSRIRITENTETKMGRFNNKAIKMEWLFLRRTMPPWWSWLGEQRRPWKCAWWWKWMDHQRGSMGGGQWAPFDQRHVEGEHGDANHGGGYYKTWQQLQCEGKADGNRQNPLCRFHREVDEGS